MALLTHSLIFRYVSMVYLTYLLSQLHPNIIIALVRGFMAKSLNIPTKDKKEDYNFHSNLSSSSVIKNCDCIQIKAIQQEGSCLND